MLEEVTCDTLTEVGGADATIDGESFEETRLSVL